MAEPEKPDIQNLKEAKDIEGLKAALGSEDKAVQKSAIEALGAIEDKNATAVVISLLKNDSKIIRQNAAQALGKTEDPSAVEPLLMSLEDEDEYVRMFAAASLVEIGEPAIDPLIVELQNENPEIRKFASNALSRIGDPVIEPLMTCLEDENESSIRRVLAAETLVEIGEKATVALERALQNESGDARKYAEWALGELHKKDEGSIDLDF